MKARFTAGFAIAGWSTARLTLCFLLFVNLNRVAAQTSGQKFADVTLSQMPDLPGVSSASVGWADYDNDGKLDVLFTGYFDNNGTATPVSKLYHNTGKNFEDVAASQVKGGLPQIGDGAVAWADYDNDGRPDFLITGASTGGAIGKLYHNTGTGFEDVTSQVPGLPQVTNSAVAWGDYDNDKKLDFLISGQVGRDALSRLYHNTGTGFEDVTAALVPNLVRVAYGSIAWADYDGDKKLDFFIMGDMLRSDVSNVFRSNLYHNTGTGFEDVTAGLLAGLPQVGHGSAAWGDYDRDGRPDLLLAGTTGPFSNTSKLYRNTEKDGFVDVTNQLLSDLPGLYWGTVSWGDYDGDKWLDFIISGGPGSNSHLSRLYHNTGNTKPGFEDVTGQVFQNLPQVTFGSATWADYDNDKHLDLLFTGSDDGNHRISRLYHNIPPGQPAGYFVNVTYKVPIDIQLDNSTAAWADYDGDGLQDFFIFGEVSTYHNDAWLFHNTGNGWENVTDKLLPNLPGGMKFGSVAWGDYDKDGRPDLLITGDYGYTNDWHFSGLYRNTPTGFVNVTSQVVPDLPQFVRGSVSWADVNQDGWLDFLITGGYTWFPPFCGPCYPIDQPCIPVCTPGGYTTDGRVYLNNKNNTFADITGHWFRTPGGNPNGVMLPTINASVAWGDYNNDGLPDFIIGGNERVNDRAFSLYTNLPGNDRFDNSYDYVLSMRSWGSAMAWGDYDSDGKLDLITTGYKPNAPGLVPGSQLLHNTGQSFEDVTAAKIPDLPQVTYSAVAWADYDGDKRLDLFISGEQGNAFVLYGNPISKLYRNTGTGFEDVTTQMIPDIAQTSFKSASWADYDKDGKPDLLLTGSGTTRIYHNESIKVGEPEQTLHLIAPLYNCQSGAFTFRTSGGNGSEASAAPIEFMAPGITSWTTNPNQYVDAELRQAADAQPITLVARQNDQEVRYIWDIRLQCPVGDPNALRMVAPLYNCTTGAITFQTTGGNGTPIEFMAAGITSWTTTPNQYVDVELRQSADAQPITLVARQSGKEIHYVWDLRAICPLPLSRASARLGAGNNEQVVLWQARVSPNPVNDVLTVQLEGAKGESVRLELRDLRGQVVVEQQVLINQPSQSARLPLGSAGSGLYLLRVSTANRSQTLKVIKMP